MLFVCWAVSRAPFVGDFIGLTSHHVILSTHCYDVMEFRSELWCSRNYSSTMRAFPGSALHVIWYFYHMADRHPRSCNISFVHFRIFFIKTHIRVWLKASETSFSTQREFLEDTLRDFGRVCTYIFWQIVGPPPGTANTERTDQFNRPTYKGPAPHSLIVKTLVAKPETKNEHKMKRVVEIKTINVRW
jgi:hypothetical protein